MVSLFSLRVFYSDVTVQFKSLVNCSFICMLCWVELVYLLLLILRCFLVCIGLWTWTAWLFLSFHRQASFLFLLVSWMSFPTPLPLELYIFIFFIFIHQIWPILNIPRAGNCFEQQFYLYSTTVRVPLHNALILRYFFKFTTPHKWIPHSFCYFQMLVFTIICKLTDTVFSVYWLFCRMFEVVLILGCQHYLMYTKSLEPI